MDVYVTWKLRPRQLDIVKIALREHALSRHEDAHNPEWSAKDKQQARADEVETLDVLKAIEA